MEIGPAMLPSLGPVAAAWAESPAADEVAQADAAALEYQPGERVDHGVEAAGVQTVASPPQVEDAQPLNDARIGEPLAGAEFALPADLAVPAALVGLQVEAGAGWPLPPHGFDPLPRTSRRIEDDDAARRPEPAVDEETDEGDDDADGGDEAEVAHADEVAATESAVIDPWCEPLSLALRRTLAAQTTPQALLAAAEQWQRGRCVVLACPQGPDPNGLAWAFVLWPRLRAGATPASTQPMAPALSVHGLRVDARLQWANPPQPERWCHVRAVKEHHPRTGRQLVAVDAPGDALLPCEVQLGPVLARSLRRCEVCVRIAAAQRFWNALGAQWSVHVVVSAVPLIDADATTLEEDATC